MRPVKTLVLLVLALLTCRVEAANYHLFDQTNLVAWCIVPFDAKKRGPEERAEMLERLHLKYLAYDWRAQHIPTFDAEVEAMQKHHIEITAWWFPTSMNADAKTILDVIARHKITPQLWVMGGGKPTTSEAEQRQRVQAEAKRIRPIAEAAAKLGCKVGLYNHGGWFGEPENQLEIIKELNLPNVGIVYNFHHGHDHLARFPEMFKKIQPYLLVVNLDGMVPEGDKKGKMVLPIGQGTEEAKMIQFIANSGWKGPVGILDHRPDTDSEPTLKGNLEGLAKVVKTLKQASVK